ncbi:hypothetical protein [Thermococcus sp.]|nr:hypothetical protein [Thermococcus sp.]
MIISTLEDYLLAIKISQAMVKRETPVPEVDAIEWIKKSLGS